MAIMAYSTYKLSARSVNGKAMRRNPGAGSIQISERLNASY